MEINEWSVRPYYPSERQEKTFYSIAKEAFAYGSPWSPVQFQETLAREDLFFFVAERHKEIMGYIGGQVLPDGGEIYTIVVGKKYQKQRMAEQLLHAFKEECIKQGSASIFLEVRLSNKEAQAFYLKHGFEQIGIRKNYYRFPKEDALLMRCSLRKKEKDV